MQSRTLRPTTEHIVPLCGRDVLCRLTRSGAAKKIRLKVTVGGLEVVVPEGREPEEGLAFLRENQHWAAMELERSNSRQAIRRSIERPSGEILFRGEHVPVRLVGAETWHGPNRISFEKSLITILRNPSNRTPPTKSLESWLRKQARAQILQFLIPVAEHLKRTPNRIYVMGQRTKWGNCSSLGNLSFNWRLIMAPDYVLRYLVVHEAVHLAIPDHSRKYWLAVQSLCPETDQARRWLVANQQRLTEPILLGL